MRERASIASGAAAWLCISDSSTSASSEVLPYFLSPGPSPSSSFHWILLERTARRGAVCENEACGSAARERTVHESGSELRFRSKAST